MVTITARYEGQLRCSAQHGPSDARVTTDAPVDNHGRGEAFSPTDLVATAFLTCTMTIMGLVAEREGIPLEGMTGEVEKNMATAPVRRIASLPLTIRVPGALTTAQRQQLEDAATQCPVCVSLHPDVERSIRFVYEG